MDNENKHKTNDDLITINDLWHLCIAHWNWFAASLIICLGYAFYYLSTTPNMYTCEAALLVKQETQGKTVAKNTAGDSFDDMGLVQQSVNVINVQRELTSLRVLTEVARRQNPKADEQKLQRNAESIRKF